ncbi:hypothetical protein [Bifidobacterium platyrrhinorum]|nr:hypothetical protein [Bifidobacterium platyrrhinorum]
MVPSILRLHDLPGPLSLSRLAANGTVHTLDPDSGYWHDHAATLYGRATIIHRIIPFASSACALTALWVWMGGDFPDTLDVLSRSHFRAAQHGHRIRVFSRQVTMRHLTSLGALSLTDPTRTACDIASLFRDDAPARGFRGLDGAVVDLMDAYGFSPDDCISLLDENPNMPATPQARAFLVQVGRCYGHRHGAVWQATAIGRTPREEDIP